MTRLAGAAAAALAALALCAASASAEVVPLEFDGQASLNYPADSSYDLGPDGTIEFWVAAGWTSPLDHDACVVSNGDAKSSRYGAFLTADGQGVVLWDGAKSAGASFDFLDGEAHHVAIATKGNESKFYVDGVLRGTQAIGYGDARGLPFHVGTSDGNAEGLVGQLRSVRLWSVALTASQVLEIATFDGEPAAGSALASALRVYSDFTATTQELVLVDPPPPGAGSAVAAAATPPAAKAGAKAPAAPPAPPVDPGVQMWSIRKVTDGWRLPPMPTDALADFRRGTIDLWVQYDPAWQSNEDHGTLVAFSNGYDTVFEIGMAPGGDGLVVANSRRDDYGGTNETSNLVPFDFTDEAIHHVIVTTDDESSDVVVDGEMRGTASVGYGVAEDANGPKTNLQLAIGSLDGRSHLFRGRIGGIRIWATPLPSDAVFRAAFLRDGELKSVPWADSYLVAQLENTAGSTQKPALRFLPSLYLPAGTWMQPTERQRRLPSLGLEGERAEWYFLPQRYVSLTVTAPDSDLAQFAIGRLSASATTGTATAGPLAAPFGFRMTKDAGVSGPPAQTLVGITVQDCADMCNALDTVAGAGCASFDYVADVQRCELNQKNGPLRKGLAGTFSFERGAEEPPAELAKPGRGQLAPARPAGSAADASVPVLVWLEVHPFQSMTQPERVEAFVLRSAGRNRYGLGDGREISITSRNVIKIGENKLQRADEPDRVVRGQPRIDDAYMANNAVRNRDAALHGWDPIQLNPFDYLDASGANKDAIFTFPPYGYREAARMIVPKGFQLIDQSAGKGRRHHTEVTTSSELQQEFGAMLSVSGGVEGMVAAGSFSANASFNAKSSKLESGTTAYTMGQSVNRRVALVVDKANARLAPEFRDAVLEAVRGGDLHESARQLVEQYGTHYAHAIWLGGRMVEIVELDAETFGFGSTYGGGVGMAVEARIGKKDGPSGSAGAAVAVEGSEEQRFNSAVQNSEESWEYSGGEGGGSGGNWNVRDETMVPIYLDLRPISELLAPPFFTEPAVFDRFAPVVRAEMANYVAKNARDVDTTERFVPKRIARPMIAPDKTCPANDSFRLAYSTDDDNDDGGGAWFQIHLPAAKAADASGVKRFDDGCYANDHWDGAGGGWVGLYECNRVCWKNAVFQCKVDSDKTEGTWQAASNAYAATSDILCHDSGKTSQDGLVIGVGPAPW